MPERSQERSAVLYGNLFIGGYNFSSNFYWETRISNNLSVAICHIQTSPFPKTEPGMRNPKTRCPSSAKPTRGPPLPPLHACISGPCDTVTATTPRVLVRVTKIPPASAQHSLHLTLPFLLDCGRRALPVDRQSASVAGFVDKNTPKKRKKQKNAVMKKKK